VAIVASIAAFNMGRVLACGRDTVMTGATGTDNLGVINSHHRRKHVRRVTVLADIRCLNMRRVFADCVGAIVAAGTVAGDIHMIEICR
jgi:hypothetical protein